MSDILDVNTVSPYCKPQPEAYKIVIELLNITNHQKKVLIDDKITNLQTAHQFGFSTILVGQNGPVDGIDACISNIMELPAVLNGTS